MFRFHPSPRHIHILRSGHNNCQDIAGGQTLITLKCKFSIAPNNLSLPVQCYHHHCTHVATVISGAIITDNGHNGDHEYNTVCNVGYWTYILSPSVVAIET